MTEKKSCAEIDDTKKTAPGVDENQKPKITGNFEYGLAPTDLVVPMTGSLDLIIFPMEEVRVADANLIIVQLSSFLFKILDCQGRKEVITQTYGVWTTNEAVVVKIAMRDLATEVCLTDMDDYITSPEGILTIRHCKITKESQHPKFRFPDEKILSISAQEPPKWATWTGSLKMEKEDDDWKELKENIQEVLDKRRDGDYEMMKEVEEKAKSQESAVWNFQQEFSAINSRSRDDKEFNEAIKIAHECRRDIGRTSESWESTIEPTAPKSIVSKPKPEMDPKVLKKATKSKRFLKKSKKSLKKPPQKSVPPIPSEPEKKSEPSKSEKLPTPPSENDTEKLMAPYMPTESEKSRRRPKRRTRFQRFGRKGVEGGEKKGKKKKVLACCEIM